MSNLHGQFNTKDAALRSRFRVRIHKLRFQQLQAEHEKAMLRLK